MGTDADKVSSRLIPVRPAPPPRRRRRGWGLLATAIVGAVIGGFLVSGYYETASLGQRLDATVERGEDAVRGVAGGVQQSAQQAAEAGVAGMGKAALALSDAGITTSIKTALAADPALSALKIDVSTHSGVVTLKGPAPSAEARDRATVLARAPQGVTDVKNELLLPGAASAVAGTAP
ncbi:MAG TPA: BON domain-containing protein [Aquabacterium sp.]|nr:BON domain-containing protein [Aquabacterium sp.]